MTDTSNLDGLDDTTLAKAALRAVMIDNAAPAAARAQAARTMLELQGKLGRHAEAPADGSKPLAEASLDDLRRELAGLG